MNKFVPIGLGAAAVVVALVIGSRLLGFSDSSRGGPGSLARAHGDPFADSDRRHRPVPQRRSRQRPQRQRRRRGASGPAQPS